MLQGCPRGHLPRGTHRLEAKGALGRARLHRHAAGPGLAHRQRALLSKGAGVGVGAARQRQDLADLLCGRGAGGVASMEGAAGRRRRETAGWRRRREAPAGDGGAWRRRGGGAARGAAAARSRPSHGTPEPTTPRTVGLGMSAARKREQGGRDQAKARNSAHICGGPAADRLEGGEVRWVQAVHCPRRGARGDRNTVLGDSTLGAIPPTAPGDAAGCPVIPGRDRAGRRPSGGPGVPRRRPAAPLLAAARHGRTACRHRPGKQLLSKPPLQVQPSHRQASCEEFVGGAPCTAAPLQRQRKPRGPPNEVLWQGQLPLDAPG